MASHILARTTHFTADISPSLRQLLRQILREEGGSAALLFSIEQRLLHDTGTFITTAEQAVKRCFERENFGS